MEGVGAKECISERARERPRKVNLAGASLVPRILTQARKRKRQICFCPRRGRGQISACGKPQESLKFGWRKESECARVPRECI